MTERHVRLEANMRARGVSPAIVARVMRLNPTLVDGQILLGIHYKNRDDPRWMCGAIGKRDFLEKYGRDAFSSLPKGCIIKRGRRAFVMREAVEDQAWIVRPNQIRAQCPNSP